MSRRAKVLLGYVAFGVLQAVLLFRVLPQPSAEELARDSAFADGWAHVIGLGGLLIQLAMAPWLFRYLGRDQPGASRALAQPSTFWTSLVAVGVAIASFALLALIFMRFSRALAASGHSVSLVEVGFPLANGVVAATLILLRSRGFSVSRAAVFTVLTIALLASCVAAIPFDAPARWSSLREAPFFAAVASTLIAPLVAWGYSKRRR